MKSIPQPSAEILEKIRELLEARKKHDEKELPCCGSSWCGYSCENREAMDANDAFPSIASLCLEQAEEIERLREAKQALEDKRSSLLKYTDDKGICWLCREEDVCSCALQVEGINFALKALSNSSHDK